ncbi:MAG: sugar ABC transporter permease [Planctomycetota bacterium]
MSQPRMDSAGTHRSGAKRAGDVISHGVLAAAASLIVIPLVWLICASLKRNEDFFTSLFLPRGEGFLGVAWGRLTLEHFEALIPLGIARAALVSVFLASVTAVVATLAAAMGGFALARLRFRGRRTVEALVLAAIVIPPTLLLAPGYQLLFQLGLLDTMAGLILPAAAPAFGVYLFRQATISSVPPQLLEAARIDGCGDVAAFFRIALPLVMPMASAFLMITFLGTWNNFLTPQVVLQTPSNFPLAVTVAQLRGVYYQEYGLLMAGTLVSIAPLLLLFLLLQRDFISGLTSGAVKG